MWDVTKCQASQTKLHDVWNVGRWELAIGTASGHLDTCGWLRWQTQPQPQSETGTLVARDEEEGVALL